MKRAVVLIVIGALTGLILSGCGDTSATPEELAVVRVSFRNSISYGPYILGDALGIFEAHGIRIEFVPALSAGEGIAAMRGGDLDVDPIQINVAHLNALAQGENIAIVANRGIFGPADGCSYQGFVARSEDITGAYASLANLAGANVSFTPTNIQGYILDKALEPFGLSGEEVERIDIPNSAEIDSLADGSIDAANASEPAITQLTQAGPNGVLIAGETVLSGADWGLMVYGPSMLGENRALGERFMAAYLEAVEVFGQGKTPENLEILARVLEEDVAFLEAVCWPVFAADGRINVDSVLDFQEWAIEKGLLDNPVAPEEVWDPSFLDAAGGN